MLHAVTCFFLFTLREYHDLRTYYYLQMCYLETWQRAIAERISNNISYSSVEFGADKNIDRVESL